MNKYRVIYGYCHPHAVLTHLTVVFSETKEVTPQELYSLLKYNRNKIISI